MLRGAVPWGTPGFSPVTIGAEKRYRVAAELRSLAALVQLPVDWSPTRKGPAYRTPVTKNILIWN